ncbi:right-handed parallel beta-helix repeat-containing protein [Paenibacillus sp. TAF43_2]|uniref:right-handed parallel beta-helix repeat-containing protein n=1 Tax=Paenibacillus sp. TAF43_2 TaxID=3233069 RepID=UPI003F9D2A9B
MAKKCVFVALIFVIAMIVFVHNDRAYAAGTTYYVSNSTGNDNNNGTSAGTPWQTLAKISNLTFNPGDKLLLKSGDTWNESVTLNGSGTALLPIQMTAYGSGSKPIIRSSAPAVVSMTNESGWIISGLDIACTTTNALTSSTTTNRAIVITYNAEGAWSNITIDGNLVRGPGINSNSEGILISAVYPTNKHSEVARNIVISNNEIYNLGWRAIGVAGWDSTLSDNLKSSALFRNVKVHNNVAYQLGNQGIVIGNSNHSTIKWNLVHDAGQYAGTGVTWGPGGIWPVASSYIDVMFNEVYNMSDSNTGHDASGLNIDWSNEYVNVQYNYAHDNKGNGVTTMANMNSRITDNKVKGNRGETSIGSGQIALSDFTADTGRYSGLKNLVVANNLIVVDHANTSALSSKDASPGDPWSGDSYQNNRIIMANGISGTSAYKIGLSAPVDLINDNLFYQVSGTTFQAERFGVSYNTMAAWRSASGFDLGSTISALDSVAPGNPSGGLAAWNSGSLGITLSWTAASDTGSGLNHYNIYRSTTPNFTPAYSNMVGESTTASFTDRQELQSGTAYYYLIEAEDNNGNISSGTTSAGATSGTIPASTRKYEAVKDVGAISQGPVWYYHKWNGTTYTPLANYYAPWRMWRDGSTFLSVGENLQSPDGSDSVRTWLAPEDGEITLSSNETIHMLNTGAGADGVNVKILKNNAQIWPASGWQQVIYGTTVSSPAITLDVIKGDAIRFVVNQNANNLYDTVYWNPIVTYHSIYLLSENFESSSGRWTVQSGNWSVVTDSGSKKYRQTDYSGSLATAGIDSWSNYTLASDIQISNTAGSGGFANLVFRVTDANNKYFVYIGNMHGIAIKKTIAGTQTVLASKAHTINVGTTYRVSVEVIGNQINLYVDGILQLSATDPAFTFSKGRIGLETYNATVLYDNVILTEL